MSYRNLFSNKNPFKKISDNLFFLKSQYYLEDNIRYSGSMPISGLVFFYHHQGNSNCDFESLSLSTSYQEKPFSVLTVNNNDKGTISIKKGDISTSSITLEKEFLLKSLPEGKVKEKIIENLETNKPCELLAKKDINPQSQLLLNTLYNNPFNNQLDELYAQSKILELIYLEFQSLIDIEPNKNNKLKLDDYDIEAIKKAKEILVQNMKNPPSIIELSHMIGINEFKLKSGFKTIFNDTPYNILLDYKLEYAKELLLASDMNVGEIAKQTGYKYIQSFTKAFVKKYGVRPIDIMKKRKYYF